MKNYSFIYRLNQVASTIVFLAVMTMMTSCEKDEIVEGMSPIYFNYQDYAHIKSLPPRPNVQLTKIVTQGNYIYMTDINLGIHVINNTDPTRPVKVYFWNIPGNTEFTIKDNVLYANNGPHLLFIDITNPADIKVISVIRDQYLGSIELLLYPRNYKGKFECYRPELGELGGWEMKTLINPLCETR